MPLRSYCDKSDFQCAQVRRLEPSSLVAAKPMVAAATHLGSLEHRGIDYAQYNLKSISIPLATISRSFHLHRCVGNRANATSAITTEDLVGCPSKYSHHIEKYASHSSCDPITIVHIDTSHCIASHMVHDKERRRKLSAPNARPRLRACRHFRCW